MKNHTGWLSGSQSRMLGGSMNSWSRSQERKFWVTPPPKGRRVDPILREGVDKRELLRQESREPLCDRLYVRDRGLTSWPRRPEEEGNDALANEDHQPAAGRRRPRRVRGLPRAGVLPGRARRLRPPRGEGL